MKKIILLFSAIFCLSVFVKAEEWVLDFGPDGLNYIANAAIADGLLENGNGASVVSCSTRNDGTLRLAKDDGTTAGCITLPALTNVTNIIVEGASHNNRSTIQKYDATNGWTNLTTTVSGSSAPFSLSCTQASELGDCTLRIINTITNGAGDIGKITVTYTSNAVSGEITNVECGDCIEGVLYYIIYIDGTENDTKQYTATEYEALIPSSGSKPDLPTDCAVCEAPVYTSKEIIHEQFNTTFNSNVSGWGVDGKTTGVFTIPVVGATNGIGTMTLTDCAVSTTATQTGASSEGRIRIESTDYLTASIELPEISSCGKFSFNANAGSATGKSFTLQKKDGEGWNNLKTFDVTDSPTTYDFDVNSTIAVTLRIITKQNGAKNIYEIWVTDYVEDPGGGTDIQSATSSKGEIVFTRYFNLNGVELSVKPDTGFFIERVVYENGSVEARKVIR